MSPLGIDETYAEISAESYALAPTDSWRSEQFAPPARQIAKPKACSRFNRLSFGEIRARKPKPLDWVIPNWMLRRETSFLAGESEAGKTFFAIDTALRTCLGWPVFGRHTEPGLVIYQIGESEDGLLGLRIPAWIQQFGADLPEKVPFVVLPSKVNLWTQDERDPLGTTSLIEEIKDIRAEWPGLRLSALYIDTFSKAFVGGNEIDGKDVGRVIGNGELLAKTFDCHVPIIHHFPKGGTTLRGHGSLKADVHAVAMISTEPSTKIRTVRFDNGGKLKDGEKSSMQFELMKVFLKDHDGEVVRNRGGEPVTSCVVLQVGEKAEERYEAEQSASAKSFDRIMIEAFFKALDSHGLAAPAVLNLPPATRVVEWVDVKRAYNDLSPDDSAENHASDEARELAEKKHRQNVKAQVTRARNSLSLYKKVLEFGVCPDPVGGKTETFVWWTGRPVRGFARTQPPKPREEQRPDALNEPGDWIGDIL